MSYIKELGKVGLYKKTQGRVTRQVTWAAITFSAALGLYQLAMTRWMQVLSGSINSAICCGVGLLIAWMAYRLVNYPQFADFLIQVGAEMNKVTWPSRGHLARACVVVIVTMFLLSFVLFAFDFFWDRLFRLFL